MNGTITVDQAITRGNKMILRPTYAIFLTLMILGPFASWVLSINPATCVVSGTFLGFVLQLLYSCYITTKWRIWAFSQVTDVHELKIAAINAKLIAADGSWQNKLEIKTSADKKALKAIQARFDEPYNFVDDASVPAETNIYYTSTEMAYIFLFWSSVAIIISLIIFAVAGLNIYAAIIFAFGCAGLIGSKMLWPKSKIRIPALTLSNEGIRTPTRSDKWADISEEEVFKIESGGRSGSTVHYQLRYKVMLRPAPFVDLYEINIPYTHLIHILYIYRRRFEAAQSI